MTDDSLRSTADTPPQPLTDPAALRDRPGVDAPEATEVADEETFENHDAWAGMAVVGITDADGRLLVLEEKETEHAILPHRAVDPGEDFLAVASEGAAEAVGVPVEIERVERVRHVHYRLAGEESQHTERHDVVFAASLAGEGTPASDRGCWRATWTDTVPENPDWDHDDVRDDVCLFLD